MAHLNKKPIYTVRLDPFWAADPTWVKDFPTEQEAMATAKEWEKRARPDDVISVSRAVDWEVKRLYLYKVPRSSSHMSTAFEALQEAERAIEKLEDELFKAETMSHGMAEAVKPGGIVVDEATARDPNIKCRCTTTPRGVHVCFKPGVIGLISSRRTPGEFERFCPPPSREPRAAPRLQERFTKFAEAAETAQERIKGIENPEERLRTFWRTVGEETRARGVEI